MVECGDMRYSVPLRATNGTPLVNWSRLVDVLEDGDIDVLVATTPENVTYLSDFWSLSQWSRLSAQCFAIARRGLVRDVELVLPLGNADLLPTQPELAPTRVAAYGSFIFSEDGGCSDRVLLDEELALKSLLSDPERLHATAIEALVKAIDAAAGRERIRIAVERHGLLDGDLDTLKRALPNVEWVHGAALLRQVRAIKTPPEVERLRAAATITDSAATFALSEARPGETELDVELRYHTALARQDARPFLTSITTGRRTVLPNGQAGAKVLEPGDLLRFDGGVRYAHYTGDLARMAVLGQPSAKQQHFYTAIKEGLEEAISAVRAGVAARRIHELAVETTRRCGIAAFERSHCGHGIGIENYDLPAISAVSSDTLEAGMIICIETPYYEFGWGGIQVEDTLLVTETGCERFTTSPADLQAIDVDL
jgi:Xaa-Pro aminopeptidase